VTGMFAFPSQQSRALILHLRLWYGAKA